MAWQSPAGQTGGKEGIVLAVGTRACNLGRVKGYCLDLQRGD